MYKCRHNVTLNEDITMGQFATKTGYDEDRVAKEACCDNVGKVDNRYDALYGALFIINFVEKNDKILKTNS